MTCVYGTGWSQSNSSCVDAALVDCDYQEEKQGRGAYKQLAQLHGWVWVGDPYKQHIYTAGCGLDVGRGPIQTAQLHGWVWV